MARTSSTHLRPILLSKNSLRDILKHNCSQPADRFAKVKEDAVMNDRSEVPNEDKALQ